MDNMTRTIKIKLQISPEEILPTIKAYTKAYNFVCNKGWEENDRNGVSLHHKTYRTCRAYLTADLTCSARTKAVESLKSVNKLQSKENQRAKRRGREPKAFSCPQSKQISVRYNDKTFTISFKKNIVSLQTTNKRIKSSFIIPNYFKQYLTWRRRSAELFIRDGVVFLHVAFEKPAELFCSNGKFVGVDRGIKNIAVTSDRRFFGGGHVKQISRRYKKLRSVLQSKGHSGKRHFRKITSKENRFRKDVNHCISKQIVQELEKGTTLVLEKLTGLTANCMPKMRRKKVKDREQRYEHSSWSYYQFEEFLKYKALYKGIDVQYVDARYTSQKCSKCGHAAKSNRKKQSIFKCVSCSHRLNADLNASFNIVKNYLDAISHPDRAFQEASCSSLSVT